MKAIPQGQYIRVDFDDSFVSPKEIVDQIKRHIDGVVGVYADAETYLYEVDGIQHPHKAEAILAEYKIRPTTCNIIFDMESSPKTYEIGVSRKVNDIHPTNTDRTRYKGRTAYQVVEILSSQPYIHFFPPNLSATEQAAIEKVAQKIQFQKEKLK